MAELILPIEVIPGTDPPIFRWRQLISTPVGKQVVEHIESLPATVEVAVQRLVAVAKQLMMENMALRGQVQGHCDRIAAQSELLSKKAEVIAPQEIQSTSKTPRGKG